MPGPVVMTLRDSRLWILIALLVGVSAVAQFIGPVVIPLGGTIAITMLPMIWGLLIAGFISGQPWKRLPLPMQEAATAIMGIAVLVLCARLAFTVGPNLAIVIKAGPALMLQELGHLFGTVLLALPLAVALRMGEATVGATFSIDREASFAMVNERYGADSPQYQGVLSMYVFGTIFGAIIVSLIASVTVSLGIFDPLALAMGSGVGSGSMMAAAAGAVVAGHPELKDEVLALAATSNLVTVVLGLYVSVWVALPLADKFYNFLTRRKAAKAVVAGEADTAAAPKAEPGAAEAAAKKLLTESVRVPLLTSLAIISLAGLVCNSIATRNFEFDSIITYVLLCGLTALAIWLGKLTKGKVSPIITTFTLGALITTPWSPIAPWVLHTAKSVDFLTLITMMLTVAGLSLGKDLPMLKGIGWKIIPVGIVAIGASFILATIVAEFALGMWH